MEFGPLGKQGGERRLNVAVSRARQQMWVFSSLQPEQIDLSRTNARGTRDLRAFLDYARRGVDALPQRHSQDNEERALGLHLSLQKALVARGWTVHSHIGCSGYQIDLAVVDPREPARYLAGVECDGESYASAANTRDRDRLRTSVLAQLGWRMLRVWTMDWWRNPAQVIDQLHNNLEKIMAEDPPAPSVETEAVVLEPVEDYTAPVALDVPTESLPIYREAHLPEIPVVPHTINGQALLDKLRTLLSVEAPVTLDYAIQRCVRSMGARKVGARIRTHLENLLGFLNAQNSIHIDGRVLWLSTDQKHAFEGFRTHPADCQRDLKDVPYLEIDNAILYELKQAFSLAERELSQIVARRFGKQKVSKDLAETFQSRLERLRAKGKVKCQNDFWTLAE